MAAVHAVVAAERGDERLLKAVVGVGRAHQRPQEREHRLAMLVEKPLKRWLRRCRCGLHVALGDNAASEGIREPERPVLD